MKKALLFTLVLAVVLSLCACRMSKDEETTVPTTTEAPTTAPVITMPDPTVLDPTIINPTIETNIPDTNVDDEHFTDMTEDMTEGNASRKIRKRIN